MKPQIRMAVALKAALRIVPLIFFLVVAVAFWQFMLVPIATENGRFSFTSPLPTSPVPTGTARVSPTPTIVVTPNATQTAGASFVATKEAGLAYAKQTAEAARLITPDPTQLFQKPHPTVTVWPTPNLAISRAIFGGIPAAAGSITKIIPPFYTHAYGFENSWYEITDNESSITYVHAGYVPTTTGAASQQGLVVVQVLYRNPTTGAYDMTYLSQFPTPTESGPVHVAGAIEERLILQSTQGTTFYFDVPARQFVLSPTITVTVPPPTESPVTPVQSMTPVP